MPRLTKVREFLVLGRQFDSHHARRISETSFEAAAVAYVEHMPHSQAEGSEVSVIVRDVTSGHVHCFHVNLDTGETESC